MLRAWLKERDGGPTDPLFPTTTGKHLRRDAIERRLARHLATAAESCPSIKGKHVTMHTLRHTAAMRLLLAGQRRHRDRPVARPRTDLDHQHLSARRHAHKQQAIDRTKPLDAKPGRYRPPRHAPEIPRRPLNMPTVSGRVGLKVIVPTSAQAPTPPRTRSRTRARGVSVNIIQRQLGHTDLGTTSTYLQGIDPSEIIDAVRSRRQPTISASAGLRL